MKSNIMQCIFAITLLGLFSVQLMAQERNPIVKGNNRITLITPTLFRLEYADNAQFIDQKTMFAHERENVVADFQIRDLGKDRYEITTSDLRMVWHNDGYPFGLHNFAVYYKMNGKEMKFTNRDIRKNNLGGAVSTLDRVQTEIPLDEGLLSRDGWYIINDTGKDILKGDWLATRDRSHVQDQYCFVYGNDFKAALASLGAISGNVPMTRKYVHGVWYCRYWDYTTQEYLDILDGYAQNDFPIDNMVFDMGWHTQNPTVGTGHAGNRGWTGYSWNTDLIADPAALIKKFHDQSVTVSLNDHPHDGIRPHESMYNAFMKDLSPEITPPHDTHKNPTIFDAGDSTYMRKFFKHAHGTSEDMGVDFWWLDWQQNYLYPLVRGTSTSNLAWLNKLYFDKSENRGHRGAGYSRWAGWGDQRYPIQFSGDAFANWAMLAFEIKLTATSGNAGCYYWAHDIGGFYGGTDPELYARWSQFGAVSAALRIHSVKDPKLDRRPWLWGDMATQSIRKSYHLRSQLMPYVYTSVWTTHSTMTPLNRAMYIDFGSDERAYNNPQQFMFGDLLLAAPITKSGEGEAKMAAQKVWFPEGYTWYDLFDGKAYMGGTETDVAKNIDEFPLFVKGGWILPMQPYTPRPATAALNRAVLRCYPGDDGADNTFTLYEDDGITNDYKKEGFATTDLNYKRSGDQVTITINPTVGSYVGQPTMRSYRLELPSVKAIVSVRVANKKIKPSYDAQIKAFVVDIPAASIKKQLCVVMTIGHADQTAMLAK